MSSRRVLIVLPEQVQLLDVAGPAQVFTNATGIGADYRVVYLAERPTTVSRQGLGLVAGTHWDPWETPDPDDLLLVPGWDTRAAPAAVTPGVLARIRAHWEAGGRIASVCAGALALAEAGVLEGRSATTHHDLVDRLAVHPGVHVLRDVLFTCEPRLHTSAGIAGGIDLALHLVAHDHGPALAARVARTLVVAAWRPGSASQRSVVLVHRDHMDDLVHRAQDVLDDPHRPPPSLERLGRDLGVSGRTLARHFVAATGMTPQVYATAVRRERATQLHAQGATREEAARAVGYADARSLRSRDTAVEPGQTGRG